MAFFHDSRNVFTRSPMGAILCQQQVCLRLTTDEIIPEHECILLVFESEREVRLPARFYPPEAEKSGYYEVYYTAPEQPGPVWYYFYLQNGEHSFYYGNNTKQTGGIGQTTENTPPGYQITVYAAADRLPNWYHKGLIYQIFPDSFCKGKINLSPDQAWPGSLQHLNWYDKPFYLKDSQGRVTNWLYYGGNLQGVIDQLAYLKSLGVNIIYFNPLFEANSTHKYNTADYMHIDRMFGGDKAFIKLLRETKKYGMSVILDGVFSHTGRDSRYFNRFGSFPGEGAYQSQASPYYKWYQFSAWPDQYDSWWGVDDLPNVNEMEPSYLDFIVRGTDSVIRHWLRAGVKGWRLDVADELPDSFIQNVREAMEQVDPQSVLIGEVWEDASNKISYDQRRKYLLGDGLHATMNYPFRQIMLNFLLGHAGAEETAERLHQMWENYPPYAYFGAMNLIGSHDTPRILTLLGEAPEEGQMSEQARKDFMLDAQAKERAKRRLKCLSIVQMLFPGIPSIYYGDETAMEGYSDPYNRASFPWQREDKELQDWYRSLARVRQEHGVFHGRGFYPLAKTDEVFAFWRWNEEECALVMINRSPYDTIEVPYEFLQPNRGPLKDCTMADLEIYDLLQGQGAVLPTQQFHEVLPPLSGLVLLFRRKPDLSVCKPLTRRAGVLAHITSMPEGGDLGPGAYHFVDYLHKAGVTLWQILPITPTGPVGSPYFGDSAFAGNPLLISDELLIEEGLIDSGRESRKNRNDILINAYLNFTHRGFAHLHEEYEQFKQENKWWLDDYALYKVMQKNLKNMRWQTWPHASCHRKPGILAKMRQFLFEGIDYECFIQFLFDRQMLNLRRYANSKGIQLIGDIPFGINVHSCDCWVRRDEFMLDEKGEPNYVLGVPPDAFSEEGQIWNMPLYNWDEMRKNHFEWWKRRISRALRYCDYLRLDHFRGFEAGFAIPAGGLAKDGFWLKGPGGEFFEKLFAELGQLPLLAEDLGVITPQVRNLKARYQFAGMKVIQFEPPDENGKNMAVYTGTHDNQTLCGWLATENPQWSIAQVETRADEIISELFVSNYDWVILPMQDILKLDDAARMNTPATVGGNWKWKMFSEQLADEDAVRIKNLCETSGRSGRMNW